MVDSSHKRRCTKKGACYLQKRVQMPLNFIAAKGETKITYYSQKPVNVFPKEPNYLKYFPQKKRKFSKPDSQLRRLSLKDLDSISSYSSDTIINFEINSNLKVEFKKEVQHYLKYRGIGEKQHFAPAPSIHSSESSEETDSSIFSTHVSSCSTRSPIRRVSPSLPHRPCSPITSKGQDSSLISASIIEPKSPKSYDSDIEEEMQEEEPQLSCVSYGSKISLSHPLDIYSQEKEPEFMDIVDTSIKRSRTDLHHLFPNFSGLDYAKSIDEIEDSINALSCEEILPEEDLSDLSSVQWLPFTRGQTKYGKQVLHEGGELFTSISSDTVIGRKMKKEFRPPSSDSRILVKKDSGSGLSPDALEDHRQKPVIRYHFELDNILSEEAMLKKRCTVKGRTSELSLNTILGIH